MRGKKREDSWEDSDDLLLATTVLFHIESGSTQLAAFEEAREKLHRTAFACGFRWNSSLRRGYENEIKEAKLKRTSIRSQQISNEAVFSRVTQNVMHPSIDEAMDQIINIAKQQMKKIQSVVQENNNLRKEVKDLKVKVESLKSQEFMVNEDLQAFVQIMKRARSLCVTDVYKTN